MPEEQLTTLTQEETSYPEQPEEMLPQQQLEAQQETGEEENIESIIDIKQKEKEIQKKKRRFILFSAIGVIFLIILISIPIAINLYKRSIKNKPIVQQIPEQPKINPDDITVENKVQYSSNNLGITLDYLSRAKLVELPDGNSQIKKLQIIFAKQEDQTNVTVETLQEGYIFQVSTFLTTQRVLDEVAQVKKDGFTATCPKTATLSDISGTTLDGIEGRTFEVTNCGADYKVTYVVKNGVNYEFAQIFKGDIGYRQVYRAETEDILTSIKFYPDNINAGPLETFRSEVYGFQFKHPKFKSDCCDLTGPISSEAEKLIVLADPETFIDAGNFDGLGVFVDQIYGTRDLNAYVDIQKKTLIDDYIVVKGEAPKLEVKNLKVGTKDGIMLHGYSWRGNDLIYVDISTSENNKIILIISIKNSAGKSFERKVDEILKSFEYFVPSQ